MNSKNLIPKLTFLLPFVLLGLLLFSCESEMENSLTTMDAYRNVQTPFGKWKLVSYADGKKITYDVILEIKNETDATGNFIINGKSSVNFYFSTCSIDFNRKTMTFYGVGSTKISGPTADITFETNYYQLLAKTERYELTNDNTELKLYLPTSEKQQLLFTQITEN